MADTKQSSIAFISLLRAAAVLLVMWDHLVCFACERLGMAWGPYRFVERYICGPLAITEHFGFFGVAIFFLISGFIITHVALREDQVTFAVKRLFRVYPPMIAATFGLVLVFSMPSMQRYSPFPGGMPPMEDVWWSCSLFNYIALWDHIPVYLLTWTLLIEVTFYAITFLTLPLLKRWPRAGMAASLFVAAMLNTKAVYAQSFYFWKFGHFTALLPCLLLGQVIYFAWAGKFRGWDVAIFAGLALEQFVRAERYIEPYHLEGAHSRFVSLAYACGVFVIAMLLNDRITLNRGTRLIAETSYSLYLWHMIVGFTVIHYLRSLPAGWAIGAAFAASIAVSYLSWRLIERPSQVIARALSRWLRPAPPATVAVPVAPLKLAA